MKMTFRAGALALAIAGFLLASPVAFADTGAKSEQATSIDVGRIKRTLQLTAEQERYWPPVENALRDVARRQGQAEQAGMARRIGRKVVSVVLDGAAIQRIAAAARPLIAALGPSQMMAANGLAQEMGLGPVVAALR